MTPSPDRFVEVPLAKCARLVNHGPLVVVTSGDAARPNAAPVQWNMPVNDAPPTFAVALDAENHTAALIEKHGRFVLNVPGEAMLPAIKKLGSASGRDGDKIGPAGLTAAPGRRVDTPHLAEALAFIECRVRQAVPLDGVRLVLGEALFAAADPAFFVDNRWTEGARTLHHLGGGVFALTGERRTA